MPELKLARIPDRTPMKLTVTILPDLRQALQDYALIYAEAYGREVTVSELVPAILTGFLESDRGFARARAALPENRK
jgi:hypothetical protein